MKIIEIVSAAASTANLKLNPSLLITNFSMNDLMDTIIGWVFVIAGIVAFFYLLYSGFIYLTAGGNPDAAKKGQQGILNAIIGLVIIALAYGIIAAITTMLK